MASTNNPTFQSITLAPGQTGYVPTGAKVIAINTTGDVIPNSSCLDLSAEQAACFGFVPADQNDDGSHHEPYQHNNLWFDGIMFNGQEYLFDNEIAWDDSASLPAAIQALPSIGPLFFTIQIGGSDDSSYGTRKYIIFKTPPSVAATLYLKMRTQLNWAGTYGLYNFIKADTYANISSQTTDGLPACS